MYQILNYLVIFYKYLILVFLQVDVKKAAPKPANPYANPKAMRGRGAARGGKLIFYTIIYTQPLKKKTFELDNFSKTIYYIL